MINFFCDKDFSYWHIEPKKSTESATLEDINPQEGTTACIGDVCQTELTFNQFAFVDEDSSDLSNPSLLFHMVCEIQLGAADCNRNRRSNPQKPEQLVSFELNVNGTGEVNKLDNGVLVVLKSLESSAMMAYASFLLIMFI